MKTCHSNPVHRGPVVQRLAVFLAVGICGLAAVAAAKPLQIVTTTSDLASIAQAVAGDAAVVTSVATGTRDPHFLQAKPSYILRARGAELWIRVGMELEIGWETPVLDGARNPRIREGAAGHLDASRDVVRLDVPTQRVTRAMGDVHPAGSPHYWLDPLNGRIVARTVCERLCELAPVRAELFRGNLDNFVAELDRRMFGRELVAQVGADRLWALLLSGGLYADLDARGLSGRLGGWYGALRPHRGKTIVAYHRSWTYFTNRFGLEIAAELEPKPGIPPSARHLASVVETVKTRQARVILIEPFYNRRAADFVAGRTEAEVLVCANSVGGQPEAEDYLSLLDVIVKRLSEAL